MPFPNIQPWTVLAMLSLVNCANATEAYSVTDLGHLPGGRRIFPVRLNDAGQVIANAATYDLHGLHAALWENGLLRDLGSFAEPPYPGWEASSASGLNNAGQVVGGSVATGGWRAFRWERGVMTDLTTQPAWNQANATDINDSGWILGREQGRPFVYLEGVREVLGLPPLPDGYFPNAARINAHKQVAGWSLVGSFSRAYRWDTGTPVELPPLPPLGTTLGCRAYGLNDAGQAVGQSGWPGVTHPCLWQADGTAVDLWPTGGLGVANDLNEAAHVVGYAYLAGTGSGKLPRAFLWEAGAIRDLNTLIPSGLGWVLAEGVAINEAGQILCWGRRNTTDPEVRAFLLTPADPKPDVRVEASDPEASETPDNPGTFTLTRDGGTEYPLAVRFTWAGTATAGLDYVEPWTSVIFPAGTAQLVVNILPQGDAETEGTETVTMTLVPGPRYRTGADASASVLILDGTPNEPPGIISSPWAHPHPVFLR